MSLSLRLVFTDICSAGCVTRDPRSVERKKPGHLKARKMPTCIAAHSSYSWSVADTFLRGQALICMIVTTLYLTKHLHLCTLNTFQVRKPRCYAPIEASLPVSPASISCTERILCGTTRTSLVSDLYTGIFYNILFKTMLLCCVLHPRVNKLTRPLKNNPNVGNLTRMTYKAYS